MFGYVLLASSIAFRKVHSGTGQIKLMSKHSDRQNVCETSWNNLITVSTCCTQLLDKWNVFNILLHAMRGLSDTS